MRKIRRHLEWLLTTDFDDHPSLDRDLVRCVILLIVVCVIIGGLSYT